MPALRSLGTARTSDARGGGDRSSFGGKISESPFVVSHGPIDVDGVAKAQGMQDDFHPSPDALSLSPSLSTTTLGHTLFALSPGVALALP